MKLKPYITICVIALTLSFMLCGCSSTSANEEYLWSVQDALAEAISVEASVTLDIQANIGTSGTSDSHNASASSNITVVSTLNPIAYHSEYYSRMLVDNATTKEDREIYVVPDGNEYLRYEAVEDTDEWNVSTLTREEVSSLPLKICLVNDWERMFENLELTDDDITVEGQNALEFSGTVDASIIQELIGEKMFGSFLYSVENLLNDQIPCVLYIDSETYLPLQIELDFMYDFIVSDMDFDCAYITVTYSSWNDIDEVSVPKKIPIVAVDSEADFYSSFFAWNLFLPYVTGTVEDPNASGNSGLSFAASWDSYQIRIDNGMTALPIVYADLNKLGYEVDSYYSSIIIEPNKYIENVVVNKGSDSILCTFYNDNTVAQPIVDCKIGSIDIAAANQQTNGIKIYLPGEILLGVSKDNLISAYGSPDETITAFASDTYIWHGVDENHSFLAEISPVTNQVIRMQIKNIPVTGGVQ